MITVERREGAVETWTLELPIAFEAFAEQEIREARGAERKALIKEICPRCKNGTSLVVGVDAARVYHVDGRDVIECLAAPIHKRAAKDRA